MLLLITGSQDGTSNLLISELENENVFRFNYDLFKDYSLEFKPDYWKITNPAGHTISSETVTSCFWWKAFNFYLMDQEEFVVEEVKYIFRELYHWCRLRGITKGTPHDFHNHMGKMNILGIASKHFKTPKTLASFNLGGVSTFDSFPVVAKSFTSGLTTTNKTLMTTAVDKDSLHPDYPWFLQELIHSDADQTIFICGQQYFAYSRSRVNLKGLDWRTEQDFKMSTKEWFRFDLSYELAKSVSNFCKELDVDWGRMDLMESNGEMIFLEFNANGQWVFLDYSGEDGLVKTVADYLMPELPK